MTNRKALTALAEPSRRRVFERLKFGPLAVGAIARDMPVSRPAVSRHLKVLKEAGLVADRPEGTRRVYCFDPRRLAALRRWLNQFWDEALVAFQAEAERRPEQKKETQGMTRSVSIAPVRKSIRVKVHHEYAFEVFTSGLGRWWPQ